MCVIFSFNLCEIILPIAKVACCLEILLHFNQLAQNDWVNPCPMSICFFYCRSIRFVSPINQLDRRANFRDYHFEHCKIFLPSTIALAPVSNDAHRPTPMHLCFPIKILDEIQFYVENGNENFEYTFSKGKKKQF